MATFDIEDIDCLITSRPEKFKFEREIRLFQFQTWIYFPHDYEMVDAAGRIAAAALLRDYERLHAVRPPGMYGYRKVDSKTLVSFLKDKEYKSLYDALFVQNGWTELLKTPSAEAFNDTVLGRRRTAETVAEMIDFRFRAIDHGTMTKKEANISRSEFFRHKHPKGYLSWRTIRSRWSSNRSSAPFLYVSEMLNFQFAPPEIDWKRPKKLLLANAPNHKKIKSFLETSLYVAEAIDFDGLDKSFFDQFSLSRARPKTAALDQGALERMAQYKSGASLMRAS